MRIFLAGGSGVVRRSLIPLLVKQGHDVTATTRRSEHQAVLRTLGATPVIVDVLDRDAIHEAVAAARPEAVIHQLTDLSSGDPYATQRCAASGPGTCRRLVGVRCDAHGRREYVLGIRLAGDRGR